MQYFHFFTSCSKSFRVAVRCTVLIVAAYFVAIPGNGAVLSPSHLEPSDAGSTIVDITPISLTNAAQAAEAQFDFGIRVQNRTMPISKIFALTNNTGNPIVITALRPSCGCTAALIEGSHPALPYTLQPDTAMSVRINIDTFQLTPGAIDKTVAINAGGRNEPIAVLKLTGSVLPAVAFSVASIDFGRVNAGESRTVSVDMTYAASIETPEAHIDLVSLDPNIVVNSSASDKTVILPPELDGTMKHRRAFTITLRPGANIGFLSGRLSAILQGKTGTPISMQDLLFTGEVKGELTVSPQVVAFGTSLQGHKATQQVLITGEDVDHAIITTGSPFVTATLTGKPIDTSQFNHPFGSAPTTKDTPPSNAAKTILLAITLSPSTPSGVVETGITITSTHKQTLHLPVFAVVTHP